MNDSASIFHIFEYMAIIVCFAGIFYIWCLHSTKKMQELYKKVLTKEVVVSHVSITSPDGDGYQKLIAIDKTTSKSITIGLHFDIPQRVQELKNNGFTISGIYQG